jgi:lysophospholipase L1-like esterase
MPAIQNAPDTAMSAAAPRNRWRAWAQNMALAIVSVVSLLGLLEIGVRLLAPVPLTAADLFLATDDNATLQGRSARRALQPNLKCRHTSSEFDVAVRINNRGLRDIERPYRKARGMTRILLVGDSFTFGYGVEESERFANRLQEFLQKRGARCEVICAGVPSWGTTDELLFLREEGLRYQPDIVVDCFYENDVHDNSERGFFALQNHQLIALPRAKTKRPSALAITRDPINQRLLDIGDEQRVRATPPQPGFWISHFHLARLLRLSAYRARHRNEGNTPILSERASSQQLTAKILEAMESDCRKATARFVIALIPSRKACAAHQSTLSALPVLRDWSRHRAPHTLLDLATCLQTDDVSQFYFARDPHLKPRGHALIGQALGNFLWPLMTHPKTATGATKVL